MRSAVVGLGRIGVLFEEDRLREKPATHVGAIVAARGVKLVAVCDSSLQRRRHFQKNYLGVETYDDLQEMLENKPIDVLHIATPTALHAKHFAMAISARVPVIVLEKPVALNLKQALKMADIARKSKTQIIINHERRFANDYRKVKTIIEKKSLGMLTSISGILAEETDSLPIDVLLHDGTHMVDILHFLCEVEKQKPKHSAELLYAFNERSSMHVCACFYRGDKKIPVSLEIASQRRYFHFQLTLHFVSGKIEIGNGIYRIWEAKKSPLYKNFYSLIEKKVPPPKPTEYFSKMVVHAKQVFDGKKKSESTFGDGLATMEFIDKVSRKLKRLKSR